MVKLSLTSAQKNMMHRLTVDMFIYDTDLNEPQQWTCQALRRKGLVDLVTDDNGNEYWESRV